MDKDEESKKHSKNQVSASVATDYQ